MRSFLIKQARIKACASAPISLLLLSSALRRRPGSDSKVTHGGAGTLPPAARHCHRFPSTGARGRSSSATTILRYVRLDRFRTTVGHGSMLRSMMQFWAICLYLGLHLEASWSCIHPPRTWRPRGGPLVILVAHCSPLYSFGAPSHSSGSQCLQGWCVGRMSAILLQPTACREQPQAALGFGLWGLTAGGSVAADVGLHAEGRLLLCGGLFLGMVLACSCSQLAVGGTQ